METSQQKRACALVRVSTEEQARGGYGLKFQEEDIRTFCERNSLELLRVFRDEGYSGSTPDRPGFREMMEWARDRRFEVLVVWKLDRLFRDTKLTLQTVDELAALNIKFRSVQESFTHDSNGRFLLTIFAAGAEKERKDINLRMYSGRIAAARRGSLVCGVSNPAYGYRYDKAEKNLLIDGEEAAVVSQIFHWYVDEKLSLYKIQCRLNDMRVPTKYDRLGRKKRTGTKGWWGTRVVGRILENESYVGRMMLRKYKRWGLARREINLRPKEDWIAIETPRIISDEIFNLAQKQRAESIANSPRNTKRLYILGKLLVCGNDGRRMQAHTMPGGKNGKDVKYYYCMATDKAHAAVRCQSRRVREDRLVLPIWQKLKELLTNPAFVLRQLSEYQKEKTMISDAEAKKDELEKSKEKTGERLRRLAEVYVTGAVDKTFYDRERHKLLNQTDQANRELNRLEALMISAEQITSIEGSIQKLYEQYRDKLEGASDEVKKEVFRTFLNSVAVRGNDLEIEVRLPSNSAIAGQQPSLKTRNSISSLFLRAHLLPKAIRRKRAAGVVMAAQDPASALG
ncbi:MAG: recombinase family protein [Acidobacteria bacterium]|nr:MAG: recombinase family protein [Acidobacteriota bacterium]